VRVLVTGGAGFIGSNLVEGCLVAGDEVRVFDDFSTGRVENLPGEAECIEGDLRNADAVCAAVSGCEVVYHQGALPSVPLSVEHPVRTHAVNATGTLNVLEAARHAGVRRVVYAASSSAYGESEVVPKLESMPADPVSPYALQKYAGERYCQQYHRLFGLETVALRYFNVYGPRQDPASQYAAVVPAFLTAVLEGTPPTVHGDGLQSRDFAFVSDVVQANRAAAVGPPESSGEVYNVGAGERSTLLDLLDAIAEALGREKVEPVFTAARAGDVRESQADISKAERLLGWKPGTPLVEGLRRTADSLMGERG
jgi:UDP-glucose 4-epimerase